MSKRHKSPIEQCTECPIGIASGEGKGQFCPFIPNEAPAGTVMFDENNEAHHVYFVRNGLVELTRHKRRDEHCAHEVGPGKYVGVEAMMPERSVYSHTAITKTDATLCSATTEGVDRWLGPPGSPARTSLTIVLGDVSCPEDE